MSNRYCGPFAASYALGVSVKEATRRLREITGRRAIRGMYVREMTAVLGKRPNAYAGRGPTVEHFAAERPYGVYVICLNDHFMVLDNGRLYDNNGSGLASEHHQRRRWVRFAWEIRS